MAEPLCVECGYNTLVLFPRLEKKCTFSIKNVPNLTFECAAQR